jgi:hypothetical protein
MQVILDAFWQIVLLRRSPEDLPDSRLLLAVAATLYMCMDLLVVAVLYPASIYIPLLLADLALIVAWSGGALLIFNHLNRVRRTLTALFGAGAILQLLAFPLSVWPEFGLPLELPWSVRVAGLVLIQLWSIAVYGHILARALSRSFGVGIALAVVFFMLNYEIVGQLIPAN